MSQRPASPKGGAGAAWFSRPRTLALCQELVAIVVPMSDSIERLYAAIAAAKSADPARSRTAKLLRAGSGQKGKKLVEEAGEVVNELISRQNQAVIKESADPPYKLPRLWVVAGIEPEEVWAEMNRRERLFGIAE